MSKSCKTEGEANETVDHHLREGTPCHYEASDGHYLVYRTEDNKTIKSVNYSPANLGAVLEEPGVA